MNRNGWPGGGEDTRLPIAVIGAGFSGTMTALHLLTQVPDRQILLYERGRSFARGTAYGTDDPVHLLNVRASNMSAFPDRPDHFAEWLAGQGDLPEHHVHETPAGLFASRAAYGRYLAALIQNELACPEGASRLRIIPDEVVSLERQPGGSFHLKLAGGRTHRIGGAIIAVGNLLAGERTAPGPIVADPWAVRFSEGLTGDRPVVVVGTGLTMVDVVTSLWTSGFSGPVLAISRRGLLPRTHVPHGPWRLTHLDPGRQSRLSELVRAFRREVQEATKLGLPWQAVLDAIRPMTASLWRQLSPEQQGRFIRHLRPWWDVHRHRMAPPVAQQLHGLIQQGYLRVAAGQIVSVDAMAGQGVQLCWSPRGEGRVERITAQRVIFATGAPAVSTAQDPFINGLLQAGLARMDTHGMGLEATSELELIGTEGEPTPGLWAIGPIVRGSFWECTAVPDIRMDAQRLAKRIAAELTV